MHSGIILISSLCGFFAKLCCGKYHQISNTRNWYESWKEGLQLFTESQRVDKSEIYGPKYFLIGARRSATNSLYDLIISKENVCPASLSLSRKEVNFFNNEYAFSHGSSFYDTFFQRCTKSGDYMDFSPGYLTDKNVPFRMNSTFAADCKKKKKFLVVFREPVSRQLSAFSQTVRDCTAHMFTVTQRNKTPPKGWNLNDLCRSSACQSVGCNRKASKVQWENLVEGLYTFQEYYADGKVDLSQDYTIEQLNTYLKYFDRSQFFIVNMDSLIKKTAIVLASIEKFFGLDPPITTSGAIAGSGSTEVKLPNSRSSGFKLPLDCRTRDAIDAAMKPHNDRLYKWTQEQTTLYGHYFFGTYTPATCSSSSSSSLSSSLSLSSSSVSQPSPPSSTKSPPSSKAKDSSRSSKSKRGSHRSRRRLQGSGSASSESSNKQEQEQMDEEESDVERGRRSYGRNGPVEIASPKKLLALEIQAFAASMFEPLLIVDDARFPLIPLPGDEHSVEGGSEGTRGPSDNDYNDGEDDSDNYDDDNGDVSLMDLKRLFEEETPTHLLDIDFSMQMGRGGGGEEAVAMTRRELPTGVCLVFPETASTFSSGYFEFTPVDPSEGAERPDKEEGEGEGEEDRVIGHLAFSGFASGDCTGTDLTHFASTDLRRRWEWTSKNNKSEDKERDDESRAVVTVTAALSVHSLEEGEEEGEGVAVRVTRSAEVAGALDIRSCSDLEIDVLSVIPFAMWLHQHNKLGTTVGPPGSASLMYFNRERHVEDPSCTRATVTGGDKGDGVPPVMAFHRPDILGWEVVHWAAPDYSTAYAARAKVEGKFEEEKEGENAVKKPDMVRGGVAWGAAGSASRRLAVVVSDITRGASTMAGKAVGTFTAAERTDLVKLLTQEGFDIVFVAFNNSFPVCNGWMIEAQEVVDMSLEGQAVLSSFCAEGPLALFAAADLFVSAEGLSHGVAALASSFGAPNFVYTMDAYRGDPHALVAAKLPLLSDAMIIHTHDWEDGQQKGLKSLMKEYISLLKN